MSENKLSPMPPEQPLTFMQRHPILARLTKRKSVTLSGLGVLITYGSQFFDFGKKIVDALSRWEFLQNNAPKVIDFVRWLISPRGANTLFFIALVAFVVATVFAVSPKEQTKPKVEEVASDKTSQLEESHPQQKAIGVREAAPNIICVGANTDWVGMDRDYTFVERLSSNGGISFVATFSNEPDSEHPEIGSIKKVIARIVFNRLDETLVQRVHSGTWLEEQFNFTNFGKGSIRKLLIGKVDGEGIRTFNDNRESEDRYLPPSDNHHVGDSELKVHIHLFSLEDSKFSMDTTLDLLCGKQYGIVIGDPSTPTKTKFSDRVLPKLAFRGQVGQSDDAAQHDKGAFIENVKGSELPQTQHPAESPAKRDYKIERLKEFVKEGEELQTLLHDRNYRARQFPYHGKVVDFLRQYCGESCVPLFDAKDVAYLRELLKELLEQ